MRYRMKLTLAPLYWRNIEFIFLIMKATRGSKNKVTYKKYCARISTKLCLGNFSRYPIIDLYMSLIVYRSMLL